MDIAGRLKRLRGSGWSSRGLLLYLLALPVLFAFLVSLVRADLRHLAPNAGALILFVYGAALARSGMREEVRYRRRKVAKPPRLPKKTLGALLISLTVAACAHFSVSHPLLVSIGLGAGAFLGFWLAYGLDPRKVKMLAAGPHGLTTEEVVAALDEARTAIASIESANRRIPCAELSRRLTRISELGQGIVDLIEEDPRDLRRARKFLNVYLTGARRVAEGYAKTHRLSPSQELESNFRDVLRTIEQVFAEQREKLLENDVLDLDVQIEVLSQQLKREGVV